MIVYFTGTGNSRYCAQALADSLQEQAFDAFESIRSGSAAELRSDRPWVFVSPTYAWRLPRVFSDWLRAGRFSGSRDAYFVMSCGDDIGDAAARNEALCREKGLRYRGTARVRMPENYIALYDAPEPGEAKAIVEAAEPELGRIAGCIRGGEELPAGRPGPADRFKTRAVNPLFYRFIVRAKPFTVSDACIGCGKCAQGCVTNNIALRGGRPVWGGRCTHCMACICGCPVSAIEYGKRSAGKPRYQCPGYEPKTGGAGRTENGEGRGA